MESSLGLPNLPAINLTIPSNQLILSAVDYAKKHTSIHTVNHCVRSAYWALIIATRHPAYAGKPLDMEAVVISAVLHDMGWATTKSLLSADRRFEVDGADIARNYLAENATQVGAEDRDAKEWDKHRLQLVWDAIALHTTTSIAAYKELEVSLVQLGISADFRGPNLPGSLITVDEYKAVTSLFPRVGFKDELIRIMCGLCRDKPSTTFDNFVGEFAVQYGYDGNGADKEKYAEEYGKNRAMPRILGALDALVEFE